MKNLLIGIVVLAVVGLGGWLVVRNYVSDANTPSAGGTTSAPHETTNPNAYPTPESIGSTSGTTYTLAQVAAHNSQSNCWSAIDGGVYDLTSWIGQHPGGSQAILSICGKDGSSAFNDQHGGQRRPENELNGFKIGILAQ